MSMVEITYNRAHMQGDKIRGSSFYNSFQYTFSGNNILYPEKGLLIWTLVQIKVRYTWNWFHMHMLKKKIIIIKNSAVPGRGQPIKLFTDTWMGCKEILIEMEDHREQNNLSCKWRKNLKSQSHDIQKSPRNRLDYFKRNRLEFFGNRG